MILLRVISVILFFTLFIPPVLAVSDTFIVNTTVTGAPDVTPPTTPSITSVIPVASTQIDISWSVSTDDVLLGGYQLFRDAVAIATTTLTSYSDTGLTPSTTYSYTVRAFDTALNYSTTSAAIGTTTLQAPVTPTSTPTTTVTTGNSSTRTGIDFLSLDIKTDMSSALLTWKTSQYARFTLRWGRSSNYELGFVSTEAFSKDHQTLIDELEVGTTYEYELIGYSRSGKEYQLSVGQFKTKESPDNTAPANVSNLNAYQKGEDVRLTWTNPEDTDFSYVRILRSHLFYPNDPFDGYIVYQGNREEVIDNKAFSINKGQYYTVFAYDNNGNVSSGAIIYIKQNEGVIAPPVEVETSSSSATTTVEVPGVELEFNDLEIYQDGKLINNKSGEVLIDGNLPVTIRIAYEKLPEHLKTITVTFSHPEDKNLVFSFLLRINKDKTAYEATIAPFKTSGVYGVSVSVFDFKTEVLTQIAGLINSVWSEPMTKNNNIFSSVTVIVITLCLLFLLALLFVIFLVRNNKED